MSRTIRSRGRFDEFEVECKGYRRDRKPWWKPSKDFKKARRRQERMKAKQAVREGREPPRVRKTDVWEWN